MKKTKTRRLFITAILCICLSLVCAGTVVYAEAPDGSTSTSYIAEKLIIELGPDWAGSEFELTTDIGKYPGVIVVDKSGRLTTELGGSKVYTLSRLQSSFIAEPVDSTETEQPNGDAADQNTPEGSTPVANAEQQEGIPTLHLVLFVGGAAICVVALILMRVFRVRRERRAAEEDEY